jgi:type I restriction enzyme S subunit
MMKFGIKQWPKRNLGEFLTVLTDYHANGSYKMLKENVTLLDKHDYAIMIRTTNLEKDDFSKGLKYISESAYNFLEKSKVYPGDILMNKIANAGSVYRMPNLHRPVSLAMNLFLLRTNGSELNQHFAFYYLKAHEAYIKTFAVGTAATTITKKAVRDLEVTVPPLSTQRKVVDILSAYDNLIENNTRRIQILETMAQAIYQEWFVHFRFPGHGNVKMVASSIGDIPEGWQVKNVSELADFVRGVEPGSQNYSASPIDDAVPFLRVGDMGDRSSDIYIPLSLANNKFLDKEDIAITLDGTVGIVRIGMEGCYSTGIRKVVIKDNRLAWSFAYCLLKSEHIQRIIRAHAKGTTIIHAGAAVDKMNFALPPLPLMKAFDNLASFLLKKILNLQATNTNLRRTRDLLLPKLISGDLDVSELDIKTAEMT